MDHDVVQGCHCDDGWLGFGCSLRRCPYGDDPRTPCSWVRWNTKNRRNVYKDQVNEVQSLVCTADDGGFYLGFRGAQTAHLTFDLTSDELEAAIEAFPTAEDVTVTIPANPDGAICNAAGVESHIEFTAPTADVPLLQCSLDGVTDVAVTKRLKGTTEYAECSEQGLCDRGTGQRACFPGFGSSGGQNGQGDRADCGYSRGFAGYIQDAVACESVGTC